MSIDLGTGDGRLPYTRAREIPDRLFVGVDANAAGMREYSGRALRAGLDNVLFVRAALEDLPAELAGAADELTVVLPWGGLLAAVARPEATALRAIRGLCRQGATADVVLALDHARDRAEILRLGLGALDDAVFRNAIAPVYAGAGFAVTAIRALDRGELGSWPSTWARRLAHAHPRDAVQIQARAVWSGPGP